MPKVCSVDPTGSVISSQGICGCVSVLATLKFTFCLIKGIMFC